MVQMEHDVIAKVNAFLIDEFEIEEDEIQADASLKDTLDLDSLDYVDLVVIIENTFGFKVNGEDFKTIITFQDFYRYIIDRINLK